MAPHRADTVGKVSPAGLALQMIDDRNMVEGLLSRQLSAKRLIVDTVSWFLHIVLFIFIFVCYSMLWMMLLYVRVIFHAKQGSMLVLKVEYTMVVLYFTVRK